MVMSQAAIDALMSQNAGTDAEDDETVDQLDAATAEQETPAQQAVPNEPASEQPQANDEQPSDGEEIDPLAGTLSAQELERVQQMAAAPPPPANAYAQKQETEPGASEEEGVRTRKWSASATPDSDLQTRVQELEQKLTQIEAQKPSGGVGDQQLEEMRAAISQVSETLQGMMAALRQLTEQSKGSLGFAAKQTFDCPECHSHGTVSVPISCTACGYESEWGFYPEQK